MTNLSGKIALVTGASRGIGAAVAKAYAKAGAHVILTARTVGALEALDDEISAKGGSATLIPLDLLDLEKIDVMGPALAERFGRLDIFVGNAGMLGTLAPLSDTDAKEWDRVLTLNATSNFRLIRTLDPLLRASQGGRAIFVSNGLVQHPQAYWGAYVTGKSALETLALVYAEETRASNVRVNVVHPGMVDTAMLKQAFPGGYTGGNLKKPDDVTALFLDLASSTCTRHGEVLTP